MIRTLSETLKNIRERGLENTFGNLYSFYQSKAVDCADPKQMGRTTILADSLGYKEPHPGFADTMSPFASDDAGFFFPPYEGDLVYCSFDQGEQSSPMVVGGFWKTRGSKTVSESGLPAEFVKADGSAPTVRGIKVRAGSALVFDETEDEVRVEMWTGKSQGIGKEAEKHHRVCLDDTKGEEKVVVASFGGHETSWQDKAGEVFIKTKTTAGHEIFLDDTNKKILIKSVGEHTITIDDDANTIEAMTQSGSKILIDGNVNDITLETLGLNKVFISDSQKKIDLTTPGQRQVVIDDGPLQSIRLVSQTPPQSIEVSSIAGTKISDATASGIQIVASAGQLVATGQGTSVTAAGGVPGLINNTGLATSDFQGVMTENLVGSQVKNITGSWSILGGFIASINAVAMAIGTGIQLRMVNEAFFTAAYNVHFHTTTIPGAPTGAPIFGLGIVGTHTTIQTTSS